jgi:hypothetical protein
MTKPLTSVGRATIVAVALAAILAGCGGGGDGTERQASPTGAAKSSTPAGRSLTDLASVDQFAALFNEKEGVPRLVLLLSPT